LLKHKTIPHMHTQLYKDFDYNWWCGDLLPCYVTSVTLQLQ